VTSDYQQYEGRNNFYEGTGGTKVVVDGVDFWANTVMGIREREAQTIAERKKTLATMLANVAELGAARMEEMIGDATLHDATIGTGVAVDKVLALTGQMSSINILNVPLPTAEERAELNAIDRKLDAIAAKLKAAANQPPLEA